MRRNIKQIIDPEPVIEGAGVRLKRSIGTASLDYLDPFLLFDDFTSGNPMDYEAGFPLHPHRGIETVTYVLRYCEERFSTGTLWAMPAASGRERFSG